MAEFACFNCGTPTDLVDEATGPICRACHNARKGGPSPVDEDEPATTKPRKARTTQPRGARAKAR